MDSTVMPKSAEADDVLAARADERLVHAYAQIARADEQLARLTEQLTRMEQEAAPRPSVIRARRRDRPALRAFIGLFAAACIIGAAFVSQSSYGEAARPVMARWLAPYVGSASWLQSTKEELIAGPGPSSVRLSSAEAAPAQATPAAPAAPQDAASRAALSSPELAQLLQTMARDLANLERNIEQLKANQQQMANDNSKAIGELKASQEEMKRTLAKVSEPTPPKASSPPVQPAPALRRPERTYQPPQARARPRYYPREWIYDDW